MSFGQRTAYQIFVSFDHLPKTLNKKLRSNRFKNHRENTMWDIVVRREVGKRLPPKPLSKAKITILRHSHRYLDYDGLVGSMKPVVDAFVTCGVLKDDSWEITGPWHVSQEFRKKIKGQCLEVLIQEIP